VCVSAGFVADLRCAATASYHARLAPDTSTLVSATASPDMIISPRKIGSGDVHWSLTPLQPCCAQMLT
jgi:hypothetical protein